MKNYFNKTSLALAFSLLGAASSMSAIAMNTTDKHQIHEVEVIADNSEEVKILVNIDGDVTDVKLPKSALSDRAQLEAALTDLPVELREKLLNDLGSIHLDDKMVKIDKQDHSSDLSWNSDSESEHVIVLHTEMEGSNENIANKLIKEFKHVSADGSMEKVFKIKHDGKLNAETL
ncbi:hypothetical protein [Thalassotalea sp. SU-HH00458]|uniref:hypothetical protein n=1 Tax=Thalassotalea sp. SU-HH00458 TaxID=3127657 RepID=UPI00310242E5